MKAIKMLYTTILVVMTLMSFSGCAEGAIKRGFPVSGKYNGQIPFGGNNRFDVGGKHTGLDFIYSAGTKVLASCTGKIIWVGDWPWEGAGSFFNTVWIKCNGGGFYGTSHMDKKEYKVKVGDTVTTGEVIGQIGPIAVSGYGDVDHVHWNYLEPDPSRCKKNLPTCPFKDPMSGLKITDSVSALDPLVSKSNPSDLTLQLTQLLRQVPQLGKYSNWVLGIIAVLFVWMVIKPIIRHAAQKRDRKKKQFFWLSVIILIIYLIRPEAVFLTMLYFSSGIWLFFAITGLGYRVWRHFNYNPELEKVLANGGTDNWEWLREAILAPVLLFGVMVALLASIAGSIWFGPKISAVDIESLSQNLVQQSTVSASTGSSKTNIQFNCNFNAVEAGLGPVKVGCDENGLPVFPIRWWNGNNFNFSISPRVWNAALAVADEPEEVLGIIVFGSAESTGYTNYQTENPAGALGTFQFLPGTYQHWASPGNKDPNNRTNTLMSAEAVRNMQRDGMKQIYSIRDKQKFISCFQGGGGCSTWNRHQEQAEYAWRLMVALRVAAGK